MNNFEFTILNFIRENLTHPILDIVMKFITFFANGGWFWILLGVAMLFFKKTRKIGITLCLALLINLIICNLTLKPLVARTRPYALQEGISLIIKTPSDFSFPSGHTSASFTGAFSVFAYNKKYGAFALVFASLIAVSRLYLFVHYPTDILGGIAVGAVCATASFYLVTYFWKKYAK